MTVNENDVLTVSFVGYKSQKIPVAVKTTVTITLEPDLAALDEVVIVSFGEQKKKKCDFISNHGKALRT